MEDVKNWIEISESRLTANYKTLAGSAGPEVEVLAVIKADAYGHSAALCAPVLVRAGAQWLGVTDPREGVQVQTELANAGIPRPRQPRMLVMSGSLADEAAVIVEHALTPVVWSIAELEGLSMAAVARDTRLSVHIEVDTGMSRQGCAVGAELDAALKWFEAQRALSLEGVMTHFASAEITGCYQSAAQQRAFEQAIAQVQAAGVKARWVHAANSSAIDNLHMSGDAQTSLAWLKQLASTIGARAMARTGLALYGFCLPVDREYGYSGVAESSVRSKLLPVMTWKARVIGVREIAAGAHVGYGGTFTATHPMRLALLPVGYADGLRRELSSSSESAGWVMFGDRRAPIVGRVSMNLTVVDVSQIPGVAVGDEVTVLGAGTSAEDHAQLAGTIPYEILCGMQAHPLLVP
ncbi:MAG: alanine racemase [Acidobacteria bacterium]|nr:alanine racemase [Acidobacteriota bacterium]